MHKEGRAGIESQLYLALECPYMDKSGYTPRFQYLVNNVCLQINY